MHFFGKAEFVFDLDDGAVVQGYFTVEISEDLVRYHGEELEIERFVAIDKGCEIHIEPSVVGCERPRTPIVVLTVFLRNVKYDFVQFMALSVIKKHIFGGGGIVSEAVSDVPAESFSVVETSLQTSPIPSVVVRPYTSAPVEGAERGLFIQYEDFIAESEGAFRRHAVDLFVEVKTPFLLERSGDDHTLFGEIR